jgi:hypothetical protein
MDRLRCNGSLVVKKQHLLLKILLLRRINRRCNNIKETIHWNHKELLINRKQALEITSPQEAVHPHIKGHILQRSNMFPEAW